MIFHRIDPRSLEIIFRFLTSNLRFPESNNLRWNRFFDTLQSEVEEKKSLVEIFLEIAQKFPKIFWEFLRISIDFGHR